MNSRFRSNERVERYETQKFVEILQLAKSNLDNSE